MLYAGDEYDDDDVTSGLSTIDPWYLLAPIDETASKEDEPDPEGTSEAADAEGGQA